MFSPTASYAVLGLVVALVLGYLVWRKCQARPLGPIALQEVIDDLLNPKLFWLYIPHDGDAPLCKLRSRKWNVSKASVHESASDTGEAYEAFFVHRYADKANLTVRESDHGFKELADAFYTLA